MDLMTEAVQMARSELENTADRVERALKSATQESMNKYYSFPEGDYYDRNGYFEDAYEVHQTKNTRNPTNMCITVTLAFDKPVDYPVRGMSPEAIYASNLSGEHGGNGGNGNVIERVRQAAMTINVE